MKTPSPVRPIVPWNSLSLREQVCQLVSIHVSRELAGVTDYEAFFQKYPVGTMFVGGEVIEDGTNRYEHIATEAVRCQAASKVPLLIAADLENGAGDVVPGLTPLPWPMALGATDDPELAYDYGVVTADEGALAGVNWALAPMADLNLHPLSANVGTRAFGDEAARVIPLVKAFVRGLQDRCVAGCAKTFPGDGSDHRDQHLTTTCNRLSRDDWEASYGKVFQELIDAGVMTVMTGHFSLPSMQTPNTDGRYDPCTFSRELVTGLLKERMGFRGVVVSDALAMGGFLNRRRKIEGALEAFAAGTDVLLWPGLDFIDAAVAALESGEIPMSRLHDALERIWRVKAEVCSPCTEVVFDEAQRRAEAVAERTAKAAMTCVRDDGRILPLTVSKGRRLLLVGITPHDKAFDRMAILEAELVTRGFEVERRRHTTPTWMAENRARFDVIVAAVERQFHRPLGPMEFSGEDARNFWALSGDGDRLVAVGMGSPYLAPWYFDHASAVINAYSATPASMRAVAAALCGEANMPGTSPVKIEGRTSVRDLSDWRS